MTLEKRKVTPLISQRLGLPLSNFLTAVAVLALEPGPTLALPESEAIAELILNRACCVGSG